MVEISVVIPTRNRAALLGHCLVSLCEQTIDPSRYEVCVVNNGSTDMTAMAVRLINTKYPQCHVYMVDEPRLGEIYARNTGIAKTHAPLIALGDDDMLAPPDWLELYLADFARLDSKVAKVGGTIKPIWGGPRPDWLTDALLPLLSADSGFGTEPRFVHEALLEGNGCYRREAIEPAGGFVTKLGRKGNVLLAAGHAVDLVLDMTGWKLFYDPAIFIHHHIHADRLTPAWFRRRYFWQGVSDCAVYGYLRDKGFVPSAPIGVTMPFGRDNWTFINDENEIPTEDKLNRLRSLGFVLANAGFIPL